MTAPQVTGGCLGQAVASTAVDLPGRERSRHLENTEAGPSSQGVYAALPACRYELSYLPSPPCLGNVTTCGNEATKEAVKGK